MPCQYWEFASWIATTIGAALTVLGLGVVIRQLYLQQLQARLTALDALFAEMDTREARLAREHIYNADLAMLRLQFLHQAANVELRKDVENTLATFERMAYKITTNQVPSNDAFNLYGGVLLSIANRVWSYVEEQREMRSRNPLVHRLIYRRYLESVVRQWIPRYCKAQGIKSPSHQLSTKQMLQCAFSLPTDTGSSPTIVANGHSEASSNDTEHHA